MRVIFLNNSGKKINNFNNIDVTLIRELYCDNNKLTVLPDLLNCEYLDCHNNKLTVLPDLPNCKYLSCSNNKLTNLPDLKIQGLKYYYYRILTSGICTPPYLIFNNFCSKPNKF